ncbi:MAG TPA: DNA-formamidopyrimidine glycosylase family protein [Pyrinomonadaceae bacterium]|jgi:formamidopyrimidine-DNA glycosylase|nr:DNA-formamidopyrimidine glycosylase family protein [Pyrinomonadaceae bacterium]
MPEGPEVRKYADALDAALTGRAIVSWQARTKEARKWLQENEPRLVGRRVERVISHGKHLLGYIEGGFYFHSHLMMWGRWQTFGPTELPERDRRERARIVVKGGAAILLSAPIFNAGEGDPYEKIEILATLGPDALPYHGRFKRAEFRRRLHEHEDETIGAALLNQRIVAGLGNYLRAEVLFSCKLNPWRTVGDLTQRNLSCLSKTIPQLAGDAYKRSATASEEDRKRMAGDPSLVYVPGREYGTRHLVFRRTNLPCLRCGEKIRQLRQRTSHTEDEEEERTRIVYFCAKCQGTDLDG